MVLLLRGVGSAFYEAPFVWVGHGSAVDVAVCILQIVEGSCEVVTSGGAHGVIVLDAFLPEMDNEACWLVGFISSGPWLGWVMPVSHC